MLNNPKNKFNSTEGNFTNILEDSGSVLIEKIIQFWNGASWQNQNKTSIKYNKINRKENETAYGWNGTDWEEYSRIFYFYNSYKKLITVYKVESFLNWDTTSISNYKYDEEGRECERIVKVWDQDRDTYLQWRMTSSFKDGNLSEKIYANYEKGFWLNIGKTNYKYNLRNKLTERIVSVWENDSWENKSRYNFIYDADYFKTKRFQLSGSNSFWDTLNMRTFIYNIAKQLIEENRKVKQKGVWVGDSKFTYDYNSDGKVVFHRFQYWVDSLLVNGNMNLYEYNENGNISQEIEQGWRNNNWENNFKVNFIYDLNGNLINKIHNNWSNGNWNNTVQYIYSYNEITDIKEKDIMKNSFELLNNYPNPFNNSTNIKYILKNNTNVSLILYNELGEKIKTIVNAYQSKGEYHIILNAGDLPSGLYFISMKIDKNIITQKIILLK